MDAQQLDGIVRVSGVTLLLLLSALLAADAKSRRIAALFAPLAVCLSGFLIGNTPDPVLRLHGAAGAAAHLVSGYAAIFLWWFCLGCFDQAFKPRGLTLAVGLAWLLIASADRGVFGPAFADKGLSWLLVAIGFGLIAHVAWRAIADRSGDLVESRREARVTVAVLLAAQLLLELSKEVIFGLAWRPEAFTIAQNAALLIFTLWLLRMLLRVNDGPLAPRPRSGIAGPAAKPGSSHRGEAQLTERLRRLIEVERAHLDPTMTFEGFVARMGAPDRLVRRLINDRLGYDHFRSFLNAHRLAEARRLLTDPGRAGDKLVAISLDSGYASLASFNRNFRAHEGCTPSEYRAAARGGAVGRIHPAKRLQTAFEERSAAF